MFQINQSCIVFQLTIQIVLYEGNIWTMVIKMTHKQVDESLIGARNPCLNTRECINSKFYSHHTGDVLRTLTFFSQSRFWL